jgi:hypothetical protein
MSSNSEVGRMERLLELANEIRVLKNKTDPVSKNIMKNKIIMFTEKLSTLNDPDFEDQKNAMQEVINKWK